MLNHINEIADLDDQSLDQVIVNLKKHLKLCLICCVPIVTGIVIIPFGSAGVLEYIIVSLLTLMLGMFFGYLASNIRMAKYEKWRRANVGQPNSDILQSNAFVR